MVASKSIPTLSNAPSVLLRSGSRTICSPARMAGGYIDVLSVKFCLLNEDNKANPGLAKPFIVIAGQPQGETHEEAKTHARQRRCRRFFIGRGNGLRANSRRVRATRPDELRRRHRPHSQRLVCVLSSTGRRRLQRKRTRFNEL